MTDIISQFALKGFEDFVKDSSLVEKFKPFEKKDDEDKEKGEEEKKEGKDEKKEDDDKSGDE